MLLSVSISVSVNEYITVQMDVVRQKISRGRGQCELMVPEHVACRQVATESVVDVSASVWKLMLQVACPVCNQLPLQQSKHKP